MDAVRRSRFASKQVQAGPAPLASFEDLPSDELESPEGFPESKGYICNIDDDSSRDLQFTTPDSLTVSSQSTPRIDSDFESQFTLTPGGDSYQGQSTSDLRTASLSSLTKDDSTSLSVKQSKGSAVSLGTLESTETEYTQRKSSWTDIFKSHNQNSAKTSNTVLSELDSVEKVSKKKSRTHSSKKDSESKLKDKHKFLSLFKKKSNKSAPVSPDTAVLPAENLNIVECFVDTAPNVSNNLSNGKLSKGKENESPIKAEHSLNLNVLPGLDIPEEAQNDLGKTSEESCDKIPDERKINRKAINVADNTVEKEYNIVLKQVEEKNMDFAPKTEKTETIPEVKDDLESSESDITLSKDVSIEKKDNDFEAETLLPHDLSEIEEEPVSELQPMSFEFSHVSIPSRQQRLEITTKPIERPRSTTPINVAPLEAFIQSVSPTGSSKIDKIKLSLPGEQYVGRRSPKKTSMKSWIDFCERGLHSPRFYKRCDKEASKSPFHSSDSILSVGDAPFSSDGNWAIFECDFAKVEASEFGNNFETDFCFNVAPTDSTKNGTDPYQSFESNFNLSSSKAISPDCTCFSYAESGTQSVNKKCDENCACHCHSKPVSSSNNHELFSNGNTFGAPNLSLVGDVPF